MSEVINYYPKLLQLISDVKYNDKNPIMGFPYSRWTTRSTKKCDPLPATAILFIISNFLEYVLFVVSSSRVLFFLKIILGL